MITPALLVSVLIGAIFLALLIWLLVRSGRASGHTKSPDGSLPVHQPEEPDGMAHARPAYFDREARRELLLLDERLHRRLLEDPGMSPEEWAKIADSVVFVHDGMCPELAVERFERATDTTVTAPERTELSPREIFARLNEQLEPEKRLRRLRELHEIVDADVYVPPEEEDVPGQSAGTSSR